MEFVEYPVYGVRTATERSGLIDLRHPGRGGLPREGPEERTARLTLGHRIPGQHADRTACEDELQAGCALCDEGVRDHMPDPVTLAEVRPGIRQLRRQDKAHLLAWLSAGKRSMTRLEMAYASARHLRPSERAALITDLTTATSGRG